MPLSPAPDDAPDGAPDGAGDGARDGASGRSSRSSRAGSRRRGRVRGHLRLLVPVAVLTVLVVVAGVLLLLPGAPPPAGVDEPAATPVSTSMLLEPDALTPLGAEGWQVATTDDNTGGDGLNTVCQAARFADPGGEGTLVRRLQPAGAGAAGGSLLQTVEVSRTTESASDAFATTLGWFAGCREARVRLVDAWRVQGLGSRAEVVRLRTPASGAAARSTSTSTGERDLLVGVVRSDRVTVSLVADQPAARATDVDAFAEVVRAAVTGLCRADAAGFCPTRSRVLRVDVPPSGEARGTLAVADLPAVPGVAQPWVGTAPAGARPNGAATTCDGADFVRGGAPRAVSRAYLVPRSTLPDRFGLTQTVGTFPDGPRAQRLVDAVARAMAGCEEEDLSVRIPVARVGQVRDGTLTAYWRLEQEVSDDRTVASWMGVARVGRHVTQVLFTPGGGADLDERAFVAVLDRARDRLRELGGQR